MKTQGIIAYASLGRQTIARTFFITFLALTFIGVQQNAAPHALTHLTDFDFSQQQQSNDDSNDKAPTSATHCAQCLVFSTSGSALPIATPIFATALFDEQSPENAAHPPHFSASASAFAARAPPTLR